MENNSSTLRLIYPQWQGGVITHHLPELAPNDASRGYYLGAHLLNFLAPESGQKMIEVPISLDINDRAIENGINSYQAILKQSKDALRRENPFTPNTNEANRKLNRRVEVVAHE